MVCRLCGASNSPQQPNCVVCSSPLEREPERRGLARPVARGTAQYTWLALCVAVGAVLGLAADSARMPTGFSAGGAIASGIVGAILGGALGTLPGSGGRLLSRAWARFHYHFCLRHARRARERVRKRCEALLHEHPEDVETQVRLAGVMWLEGSHEQAEQVLLRAMSQPDPPVLARHNYAVVSAAAGRALKATEDFDRVAPHLKQSVNFHWNVGLTHWTAGRFASAAEAWREAMRLAPDRLEARRALGLALAQADAFEESLAELEAALRLRPRDPDVLCALGVIYESRGDLTLAGQAFSRAVYSEPAHVAARYNRALVLLLDGKCQASLEDLNLACRLAPNFSWAHIQRAIGGHRLGQSGRALEAARQALQGDEADAHVWYNAGTLLVREGLIEQAVRELERAYELAPSDADVLVNLGTAMYLSERTHQALDHFRLATRVNTRHALARYNAAVLYTSLDRLNEAESELQVLLELYPDFPEAFNEIGLVFLRQDRLLEAAGRFRAAVEARPQSAVARANLALTYIMQGDYAAALEQARLAISLDPKQAGAREIAGRACMEVKERAEAIEHFAALARLEPSNPDAHANLGLAYYRDDRLNEAIECYKRVLVFSPHAPEGHNDLGLAYAKSKMLGEAVRHLRQVIDWRPDNPIAHSNLGLVFYFKADSESAVDQWREVTRLSPQYARKREATRFSAYDEQELVLRKLDPRKRCSHFSLKGAGFRHRFRIPLDERDYRMELPWPDLALAERWETRARRAQLRMLRS